MHPTKILIEPQSKYKQFDIQETPRSFSVKNLFLVTVTLLAIALFFTFMMLCATTLRRKSSPVALVSSTEEPKVVSREEWHAEKPRCAVESSVQPASHITIYQTVTAVCTCTEDCLVVVRQTEQLRMCNYGFYVGGDGTVYEGLGWSGVQEVNITSVSVMFIGTFLDKLPSSAQMKAGKLLIQDGVRQGKIQQDFTVRPSYENSITLDLIQHLQNSENVTQYDDNEDWAFVSN